MGKYCKGSLYSPTKVTQYRCKLFKYIKSECFCSILLKLPLFSKILWQWHMGSKPWWQPNVYHWSCLPVAPLIQSPTNTWGCLSWPETTCTEQVTTESYRYNIVFVSFWFSRRMTLILCFCIMSSTCFQKQQASSVIRPSMFFNQKYQIFGTPNTTIRTNWKKIFSVMQFYLKTKTQLLSISFEMFPHVHLRLPKGLFDTLKLWEIRFCGLNEKLKLKEHLIQAIA